MEFPEVFYDKYDFIEINCDTKVSRKSFLCGKQNIITQGKNIIHSDAHVRGDLAEIQIGTYCIFGQYSVLRPPYRKDENGIYGYAPVKIGNHVYIGEGSAISAAHIGSNVYIGKNVVVGPNCVLNDFCVIADNALVPTNTVVPSFMRFEGNPAKCSGKLPEFMVDSIIQFTEHYYGHFIAAKYPQQQSAQP